MNLQRLCTFAPVISNRAAALANPTLNLPGAIIRGDRTSQKHRVTSLSVNAVARRDATLRYISIA
jgi:hypothetical protein